VKLFSFAFNALNPGITFSAQLKNELLMIPVLKAGGYVDAYASALSTFKAM